MFHNDIHGMIVWYEDLAVALVFTLWSYDWVAEKIKAYRERKQNPNQKK